jgi:hypothetical protein
MALPDYFKNEAGTELTWVNTGGDFTLTLTSLANDAARQGAKGDLTAQWAQRWAVYFQSSVGSAATNGNEIEVYWAASKNATAATENPGNTSGSDAALSNPDELKHQLIYIGSLILSNARGTNTQAQYFEFYPPTRYGMPVIVNKSGQTLGSTAGDHEFTIVPVERRIQDAV